jgi:hypothetical protein
MAEEISLTPSARYYLLHREEKLAKFRERYNNRPDVIAKRQEKQARKETATISKKVESEEEKQERRLEKQRLLQEKTALARASKRKSSKKEANSSDAHYTSIDIYK